VNHVNEDRNPKLLEEGFLVGICSRRFRPSLASLAAAVLVVTMASPLLAQETLGDPEESVIHYHSSEGLADPVALLQNSPAMRLSNALTPSLTHSYGLFVARKKLNSFAIKQIQTLSTKHPGYGVPPRHLHALPRLLSQSLKAASWSLIDFLTLCFHTLTNPFSHNSFICISIQNPRVFFHPRPIFRRLLAALTQFPSACTLASSFFLNPPPERS